MQQNPNGYPYYPPPVNNQPYGQPVFLDPRFDMILQHIARLEQHQIAKTEQAALAEEAYSEITENAHQLWVSDKRGIKHMMGMVVLCCSLNFIPGRLHSVDSDADMLIAPILGVLAAQNLNIKRIGENLPELR